MILISYTLFICYTIQTRKNALNIIFEIEYLLIFKSMNLDILLNYFLTNSNQIININFKNLINYFILKEKSKKDLIINYKFSLLLNTKKKATTLQFIFK